MHAVFLVRQRGECLVTRLMGGAFQQAEAQITFLTVSCRIYWRVPGVDVVATVPPPQLIYEDDFNQR